MFYGDCPDNTPCLLGSRFPKASKFQFFPLAPKAARQLLRRLADSRKGSVSGPYPVIGTVMYGYLRLFADLGMVGSIEINPQ